MGKISNNQNVLSTEALLSLYTKKDGSWSWNPLINEIDFSTHSYSFFEVLAVIGKKRGIITSKKEYENIINHINIFDDPKISYFASTMKISLKLPIANVFTLASAKYCQGTAVFTINDKLLQSELKEEIEQILNIKIKSLASVLSELPQARTKTKSRVKEEVLHKKHTLAENDLKLTKEDIEDLKRLLEPRSKTTSAVRDETTHAVIKDEQIPVHSDLEFNLQDLKTYNNSKFKLRSFPLTTYIWAEIPQESPSLKEKRLYLQIYLTKIKDDLDISESITFVDFSFPTVRKDVVIKQLEKIAKSVNANMEIFEHPKITTYRFVLDTTQYETINRKMVWFAVGEFLAELINRVRPIDHSWQVPNKGALLLVQYKNTNHLEKRKNEVKSKANAIIDLTTTYKDYLDRNETIFIRAVDNIVSNIVTKMFRGETVALCVPQNAPELPEIRYFLDNFSKYADLRFSSI